MRHRNQNDVRWIRWLAVSRGLPTDHVAFVLGIDQADVDEVLRRPPGVHYRTVELDAEVRELRRRGETCMAIALRNGDALLHCLGDHQPSQDHLAARRAAAAAWRRGSAESATKIKRLASLGYDPGRIAAILCIRRAEIADFLERLEPARPERTGTPG